MMDCVRLESCELFYCVVGEGRDLGLGVVVCV